MTCPTCQGRRVIDGGATALFVKCPDCEEKAKPMPDMTRLEAIAAKLRPILSRYGFEADKIDWLAPAMAKEIAAALRELGGLTEALHASAPTGCKCSDCTIDGEPCPECYARWWKRRHPNVETIVLTALREPEKELPDSEGWWWEWKETQWCMIRIHKRTDGSAWYPYRLPISGYMESRLCQPGRWVSHEEPNP